MVVRKLKFRDERVYAEARRVTTVNKGPSVALCQLSNCRDKTKEGIPVSNWRFVKPHVYNALSERRGVRGRVKALIGS
jgi:hypothetical protein